MWPWLAEPLTLGIDRRSIAIARGHEVRALAHDLAWASFDASTLRTAIAKILDGKLPRRPRLLLGADICRHWVLEVPQAIRSLTELKALAHERAGQLFGPPNQDASDSKGWKVTASWRSSGAILACAAPAAWIDACRTALPDAQLDSALRVALAHVSARVDQPLDGLLAWATPSRIVLAGFARGQSTQWRCVHRISGLPLDKLPAAVLAEAQGLSAAGACSTTSLTVFGPSDIASAASPPLEWQEAPWSAAIGTDESEAAWAACLALAMPAATRRRKQR